MSLLDELLAKIEALPEKEREALKAEAMKATKDVQWIPNPGPQTDAYFCKADVLLYGGQGGGGKSDLLLGLAFTSHKRSLIMRRQYTDLGAITERAIKINGGRDGFNGSPPPKLRTKDGRLIEFGAAAKLGDEQHWQGQPHDLLGFDEAVQFLELQVRFLMGWVRSADEGLSTDKAKTRSILATNPPITAEGQWIVGYFRPWLDITHHNPAKPGDLRWFVTDPDGKDMEVDGPEPITFPGLTKPTIPKSRTFIPAALADNPFLINTGYQAELDALPEPYRSAVRDGNFMAARQDAPNQVIPAAWVISAQERWTKTPPRGIPMCTLSVDASGGGDDPMVLSSRHDGWFAELIEVPGKSIPMASIGKFSAGVVVAHRRDGATVVVDMGGGYGSALYEHLKDNDIQTVAYKGAETATKRTFDRKLGFVNKRSESYWKFREALDPNQPGGSPIALPPDPKLVADLTAPTFEIVARGVKVEPKEKIIERLGRSTDRGDAVVMAWSAGATMATHASVWSQAGKDQMLPRSNFKPRPQVILGHAAARRRHG
jgi:hypothetical protein